MRLGIIGCGAITRGQHLPAAIRNRHTEIAALVDRHVPHAQQLADEYGLSAVVAADYQAIIDQIDIAIVAVPHHLHAPIALDLLQHGIHVLVEKPMAITAHDCSEMIQAAQAAPGGPVVLAVGHVRRFYRNSLYVKEILKCGLLGPIKSVDCREGTTLVWPRRSPTGFRYDKEIAGGGVLADLGVQVLDLLLWWFDDDPRTPDWGRVLRYVDDDMGGVEANCLLEIDLHSAIPADTTPVSAVDSDTILSRAVSGTVELSRTRDLRNSWILCGERGTLEVGTGPESPIHLQLDGQQTALTGSATKDGARDQHFVDVFARQYEDFVRAVMERDRPLVPGEDGARVVDLMETCYAHREPFEHRWLLPAPSKGRHSGRQTVTTRGSDLDGALRERQVLVTGGTGFVGGRLIEKLVLEQGAHVRVLIRSYGTVARIARLPIELVKGDITDAGAVQRAVDGCEIVFHCAYGNSGSPDERRQINVGGTENVMQAALRADTQRVVHLSTLRVYGDAGDGDLDETASYRYSGNVYSDTKLDAENVVQSLVREHGLPATILQPTHIYGPHGPLWSADILERLKTDRVVLVNGGTGLCNVVYIDDVVDAILLGATVQAAVGEAFLISDEAPIPWIEYYEGYRNMLGRGEMVSFSAEELLQAYDARGQPKPKSLFREILDLTNEDRQIRRRLFSTREIRCAAKVGKRIVPRRVRRSLVGSPAQSSPRKLAPAEYDAKPTTVPTMDPAAIRAYAAKTRVRIDKAKRVLGYRPRFDLESGLERTAQWAEWANLL